MDARHSVELPRASIKWKRVLNGLEVRWSFYVGFLEAKTRKVKSRANFCAKQWQSAISGLRTSFVSSSWANFRSACAAPLEPFESDG